ncbi:MAG: hypothetical protein AAGG99_09595 [Pseudomonadota bacterium]
MASKQHEHRVKDQPAAHELTETDLANEKMGNNQLQGDDQKQVHNQRHAQPGVRREPYDGVDEMMDEAQEHDIEGTHSSRET